MGIGMSLLFVFGEQMKTPSASQNEEDDNKLPRYHLFCRRPLPDSRSQGLPLSRADGRTRRSLHRNENPFGARLAGCIQPGHPSCLAPSGRSLRRVNPPTSSRSSSFKRIIPLFSVSSSRRNVLSMYQTLGQRRKEKASNIISTLHSPH